MLILITFILTFACHCGSEFMVSLHVHVCEVLTSVGLALLTGPCGVRAVLGLDLDKVGALLLTVEGGPRVDHTRVGVDAEILRVPTLILQNHIVYLQPQIRKCTQS